MTPILVTGAAGVVGSHVIRQLCKAGRAVVAADVVPGPGPLLQDVPGYEYRRLDVRDLAQIMDVLTDVRPERVVHLAAVVGDWCNRYPLVNHDVNIGGTLNMLDGCRLAGVRRIVLASTWSLYPDFRGTPHGHPTYTPVPEDTCPAPGRPYEIAKYTCERLAAWYRQAHGLEFAALRFGSYYTAERWAHREPRAGTALSDMITAAAAGRPFRMERGREQGFDAIHVKDCAGGCVAAVLADATPSGVYNIGTGEVATLGQAAALVGELVPGWTAEIGPGLLSVKHYCRLNITRARTELGYAPKFPLRDGIADCLAALRDTPGG